MPTDPGRTISWAKTPAYSTSLLNSIINLPSRADKHALFSSAANKSTQWKTAKANALERVTGEVFDAGGDPERAKKQRESTQRRINQLGKSYSDDIASLKADPYNAHTTLGDIRATPNSFFDLLRQILHDHPDFPSWDPNERYEDQDQDDADADANEQAQEADEEEDDAMQDVQHAPLAGPAYPNPLLPHHAPYLPPQPAAPAPQPAPQPVLLPPPPQPAPQLAPAAPLHYPPPPPAPYVDDDGLDSCPVCSLPLSHLPASASESHLRSCLDSSTGGGGATVIECPVCGLDMSGSEWNEGRKERHVGECCEGAVSGTVDDSGGSGGRKEVKRGGVREHVVFVATEKTVPKDPATGEALECIVCFDSLLPPSPSHLSPSHNPLTASPPDPNSDETLARLSCHCVFHSPCIIQYWQQFEGRWCPTHREMDRDGGAKGEVEMR